MKGIKFHDESDSNFYVSVVDGPRKGLLAGPYSAHQEALDMVSRVREMAYKVDVRAVFYAFGTCKTPPGYDKPGVLNDLLREEKENDEGI